MNPKTIVSYDDTPNDHDALALGHVLARAGAELELAYVRHTTLAERSREELEEHEAQALLERGARWLGAPALATRVIVSASTGDGLAQLAEREEAQIVVFGSDYRTAARHVAPVTAREPASTVAREVARVVSSAARTRPRMRVATEAWISSQSRPRASSREWK